jgi:transposase
MCLHVLHKLEPEKNCDVAEGRSFIEPESVFELNPADLGLDAPNPVSSVSPNEKLCDECPLNRENSILKCEKAYWKTMHQKAVERESKLKQEKADLEAKLRLREKQLFGRKSEKSSGKQESSKPNCKPRPRGQQAGSRGHGRRDYSELPAEPEIISLCEEERTCSICGCRFEEFPETEDSEIIEIEVRAHRRIIKRKKYIPTCHCHTGPGIISAPPAPRILPKGIFGISVWVHILLDKYRFMRPTNRLLDDLRTHDLDIAQGTVTDGLKRMAPVFEPVYEAIIVKNLEEQRWHADETRWFVFASIEGKIGYRWYLWVFISESTVVYRLDPSRSAEVP